MVFNGKLSIPHDLKVVTLKCVLQSVHTENEIMDEITSAIESTRGELIAGKTSSSKYFYVIAPSCRVPIHFNISFRSIRFNSLPLFITVSSYMVTLECYSYHVPLKRFTLVLTGKGFHLLFWKSFKERLSTLEIGYRFQWA